MVNWFLIGLVNTILISPIFSGHQYNYHRRSTGHLLGSDNRTTTDYGFIDAPPPPPQQQTAQPAKFEPNRAGPQTPSAAQRPKSILSTKSSMALSSNTDKQFTGESQIKRGL